MSNRIVVADAGPLLALAKLDALDLLANLYGVVYTSPIGFKETVTEGLAQGAFDAPLLKEYFDRNILLINSVQSPPLLEEPFKIHMGERENIQLAIQLHASEFLVDDLHARKVAEQDFAAAKLPTIVRGTLGIIYLSFQQSYLPRERAIQLLETIELRRDIWISAGLCVKVLQLIRAQPPNSPTP